MDGVRCDFWFHSMSNLKCFHRMIPFGNLVQAQPVQRHEHKVGGKILSSRRQARLSEPAQGDQCWSLRTDASVYLFKTITFSSSAIFNVRPGDHRRSPTKNVQETTPHWCPHSKHCEKRLRFNMFQLMSNSLCSFKVAHCERVRK